MEAFGFNYKAWLKGETERNPIMFMSGAKNVFGNIRSNNNKDSFTFRIVKRTTEKMKRTLYDHIESMFNLATAKVFVKRKKYELVTGVNSIQDLDEFITSQMRGKRQLYFRISR